MATTSLWRVRGYIGKVLLYAENPEKTTLPKSIGFDDADKDTQRHQNVQCRFGTFINCSREL